MPEASLKSVAGEQTVVLIHGLYMRGFVMGLLARRLQRLGYRTLSLDYPSLRSLAENARRLADWLITLEAPYLHFVAHSLGGLVVRHIVALQPALPPGRVVTLGTPHQGSQTARGLSVGRLRFILGRSIDQGLLGDAPPWPTERELGSIAGTLNAGMGRFLTPLPSPADGTVAVSETFLPGLTDHICLPVSHTGLLLSPLVAAQVYAFLVTGQFDHSAAEAVEARR